MAEMCGGVEDAEDATEIPEALRLHGDRTEDCLLHPGVARPVLRRCLADVREIGPSVGRALGDWPASGTSAMVATLVVEKSERGEQCHHGFEALAGGSARSDRLLPCDVADVRSVPSGLRGLFFESALAWCIHEHCARSRPLKDLERDARENEREKPCSILGVEEPDDASDTSVPRSVPRDRTVGCPPRLSRLTISRGGASGVAFTQSLIFFRCFRCWTTATEWRDELPSPATGPLSETEEASPKPSVGRLSEPQGPSARFSVGRQIDGREQASASVARLTDMSI
jgi:hypothetical protein